MDRVYLVPGFFGFANLGDMRYFGHVADFLRKAWVDPVGLHVVRTLPTASISRRAAALHEAIAATVTPSDRILIVGHSSGGLDARLWASPGVALPGGADPSTYTDQLAAVVTVSTPHRGTPSAEAFSTVAGKRLLRLLSLMTIVIVRRGGLPLRVLLQVGDVFTSVDRLLGSGPDVLDEVFHRLLGELSPDRRDTVEAFFRDIGDDQALLPQLVPASMDVFDVATVDRPGVKYGCVVSRANPPGIRGVFGSGASPVAHATYVMYSLCWQMASRLDRTPDLPDELLAALRQRWPKLSETDNDGMVPTLSQAHGALIRGVDGDHLDVLGHFGDTTLDPPSYDWFNTGTGFERSHFEAMWTDVREFVAEGG